MGGTQPDCWHLAGSVLCLLLFFLSLLYSWQTQPLLEAWHWLRTPWIQRCAQCCVCQGRRVREGSSEEGEGGRGGWEGVGGRGVRGNWNTSVLLHFVASLSVLCASASVLALAASVCCSWPPSSPHSAHQHRFDKWSFSKHSEHNNLENQPRLSL